MIAIGSGIKLAANIEEVVVIGHIIYGMNYCKI